ncbi:MAG TPA: class I lanthipeptide [Thermoanaerobaculia bacterium]|nr:class I lanthipeptide [Thermoanaerobaculia bacterium]
MKKKSKKLGLSRETLTNLTPGALEQAGGGAPATWYNCPCQESVLVCSIQKTCVSCVATDTCTVEA